MADQYNDTTGKVAGVIDEDDPLAELARIIGYDRPAPSRPEETGAQTLAPADTAEIDLEAELLRELEPAYAEAESRVQPAAVTPPPLSGEPASDAGNFPFEQDEQGVDEPVSADPIAGLPDEPPFDPFSADDESPQPSAEADDHVAEETWGNDTWAEETWAEENLAENGTAPGDAEPASALESGYDLPDIDAAEIDLPEDELYQALEDELTISEDDLVDDGSDGLSAAPVVPDFGDEELPADEAEPAPVAYDPAPAAYDETETVDFAGLADEPETVESDDFEDVLAEWDAMVEGDEPVAETSVPCEETPHDVATADQHVADIPPFLGSAPEEDSGTAQSGGHDDDILADMSRFELPVFGATVSVADHAAAQEPSPVDTEDAPSLILPEDFDADGEAETPPESDLTGFDDFEDELSADLDAFSKQLETGEMVIEPAPAPVDELADDEFPEIEADFDDAAEDFLADTDFDLVVEDFKPVDDPTETDAIEEMVVSDVQAEDPLEVPESAAALAGTDDLDALYPDFAQDAGDDIGADDDLPELDWMSGDENPVDDNDAVVSEGAAEAPQEVAPQEEQPYDAFFPQQPVITVPPVPAASAAEPVEPALSAGAAQDEEEPEDWLASLEAEMEEDVAEQEAEMAAVGSVRHEPLEPELPEPDLPYATVDDTADIAFDQSAIADVEEAPGNVGDFEIPDMPVDEAGDDEFETFFESELDREFADLVEAEGHEDIASASATAWYASQNEAPAEEETYSDFESDLGFSGPAEGGYRPHPQPVDADAPVASDGQSHSDEDRRKPLIAGIVLGVALLLGGVAFGWNWMFGGSTENGGPKVIMADKDPVKVVPENPGGAKVPNQDKAVYEKVEGNDSGAASQPRLVDGAEEPVDVVQRTIDPDMLPLEGRDAAEPTDIGETGKVEDRLTEGDTETAAASGNADQMLSPRRVRTMIVRPDGTIVARPQEEVAAAETATPATAEASEPAAGQAATALDTAPVDPAQAAGEAAQAGTTTETPAETAAAEQGVDAANGEAPVRTVTTVPVTQTPVPTTRPADQPVNVVGRVSGNGTVSEVASADPAAAAPAQTQTPAQTQAPANPGGYYMQIASQPSAEGAQASYQNLSSRFSSIIGGRGVDIQRAEIPDRGVYHRVRIPAGTREEANALCARYKSAGGSCLVTR